MIRRIILENFMSHRRTVIEPAPGLTVLVGENNCGKSAVVAALQILCNNTSGEYMVRHGQKQCRVVVETDEGHVVEWKRNGGTVSYSLNGEPVFRLRSGIPDNLHELLRMPRVYPQDGGEPFDVHFAEQKKPVFLLNESGSRAAKFFASSSDAEALMRMQMLHKNNVNKAIQVSNQLRIQLGQIDCRLEPLKPVEDIQSRLDVLYDQHAAIMAAGLKTKVLVQNVRSLQEALELALFLGAKTSVVGRLATPPEIRDTRSLSQLIANQGIWLDSLRRLAFQQEAFRGFYAPPILTDTRGLEILITDIAQADRGVRMTSEMLQSLSSLHSVPRLAPAEILEIAVAALRQGIRQTRHRRERTECIALLQPPPEVFDVESLIRRVAEIENSVRYAAHVQERTGTLGECTVPPLLVDESPLKELLDKLQQTLAVVGSHRSIMGVIGRLSSPPLQVETVSLETLIKDLDAEQRRVNLLQLRLDQSTGAATDAERALRDWVAENPVCPTCGAELDPDRLLALTSPQQERGHSHG